MTRGNVVCDQIDIIINGLKFCDFYLSLVTTPGKFFVDWAKENGPTKLVSMIPPTRRTPATQQAIESAWKGFVTFQPSVGKISGADLAKASGAEKFTAGYEFARARRLCCSISADTLRTASSRSTASSSRARCRGR